MIKRILASLFVLSLALSPLAYSASTATCNDTDCKSANHFDGVDGATATTDSSASAPAWTFVDGAQLDTAQFKFGTASLLTDGTGDYITTPDSANYDFSGGVFTIRAHIRVNSLATNVVFASQGTDANNYWIFYVDTAGELRFKGFSGGSLALNVPSSAGAISTATWYHVAINQTASGETNVKLFKDGTAVGTGEAVGGGLPVLANYTSVLYIGRASNGTTDEYDGWIDEIGFYNGTAIYGTSNFTAPTAAYSDTCAASEKNRTLLGVG